jgi:hypothetical protein
MPAEEISHGVAGSSEAGVTSHEEGGLGGGRLVVSAALIGAGVLVEPELLGGALLGAGVLYGLPLVAQLVGPFITAAVQLGYSAVASVSDLLTSARDQVQGMVSTARADYPRSRGSSNVSEH